MKITFLTEEWTRSTKGSCSTFMRQMAIELSRLDLIEIGILIPSTTLEDKEDAQKYNIKVFEPEKYPGYELVDCLQFPPQGFSTDFIISHGIKLGCHGQVLKNILGCKWVHVAPGAFSAEKKQPETEVKLCVNADVVLTVGSRHNEIFNSALRQYKNDHIFNIIPGIFYESFGEQKQYRNSKKFEILVFGEGNTEDFELEGLHVAAKAVAHLNKNEPSYILKVVGAPEREQSELTQRLACLGISRSHLIVRSFYKERRKLALLLSEVDLVLMPSATEAFGLTALEALSAGVPILITHNSGLAEALEKVPFGRRCIVYQVDDWAEQIKQIRTHQKTGLEEARMLRDKYGEKYCWMDQCAAFVRKLWALHSGRNIYLIYIYLK